MSSENLPVFERTDRHGASPWLDYAGIRFSNRHYSSESRGVEIGMIWPSSLWSQSDSRFSLNGGSYVFCADRAISAKGASRNLRLFDVSKGGRYDALDMSRIA